ncbi:MAG: hypothetical protein FWH15_04455 [Betaproteobacteria bacterium]|nr:hypothetical protein [Betaproteobacteria bacterium]
MKQGKKARAVHKRHNSGKQKEFRMYYKNLAIENDFEKWASPGYFDFQNNPEAWFDHWHCHFDWEGFGNDDFSRRKPHLDKLFRHFEILVNRVKFLQKDFQLFAMIHDYDSAGDALYLHTPNPNESCEFPMLWENVLPECTLKNKRLIEYLNQQVEYERFYRPKRVYGSDTYEASCILFKKDVGIQTYYQS